MSTCAFMYPNGRCGVDTVANGYCGAHQGQAAPLTAMTPTDRETCTCSPDDFGMGHGDGCPVGTRNKRRSVLDMCERMIGYGVPESAVAPVRDWANALGKGSDDDT